MVLRTDIIEIKYKKQTTLKSKFRGRFLVTKETIFSKSA